MGIPFARTLSLLLAILAPVPLLAKAGVEKVFAKDNLVAWCIVPFDAKKRGPAERADMAKRLGFTKIAYDWRGEHIPTFEQEILEYKKRDIEFFAFWNWHDSFGPLIEKHDIKDKVKILHREEKYGEVRNTLDITSKLDPDDIVVRLDAGDWLPNGELRRHHHARANVLRA